MTIRHTFCLKGVYLRCIFLLSLEYIFLGVCPPCSLSFLGSSFFYFKYFDFRFWVAGSDNSIVDCSLANTCPRAILLPHYCLITSYLPSFTLEIAFRVLCPFWGLLFPTSNTLTFVLGSPGSDNFIVDCSLANTCPRAIFFSYRCLVTSYLCYALPLTPNAEYSPPAPRFLYLAFFFSHDTLRVFQLNAEGLFACDEELLYLISRFHVELICIKW